MEVNNGGRKMINGSNEWRKEGPNEEKTERGRGQNRPPQPKQMMRVWGKKKRTKGRRKRNK